FIAIHNVDSNIYYNPNPTKTAVLKKPKDNEMARADFVHSDLDPLDDESPEAAKARYLSNVRSYEHKPTFLIDSGNGIQPLWRLEKPLGPEVKYRNRAVMRLLGAEDLSACDISRVLRLPGTVNWPTPSKLKKGRVPCMSALIEHNEGRYAPDVFPV